MNGPMGIFFFYTIVVHDQIFISPRSQWTYFQNPCLGNNSLLQCWIWMIFHKTRKLTQSERAPLGGGHVTLTLTFDILTPKSIGVFLSLSSICVWYMKSVGWTLFELSRDNEVWTDGQTDGRTDGRTDGQTDKVITIGLPHLRWRGPKNCCSWPESVSWPWHKVISPRSMSQCTHVGYG